MHKLKDPVLLSKKSKLIMTPLKKLQFLENS